MSWLSDLLDWLKKQKKPTPKPEPKPEPKPTPTPDPPKDPQPPAPEPEPPKDPEPKPEPEPPATGPLTTKSFWVHWNTVLKNDQNGRDTVAREAKRRAYLLLNTWDNWAISVAKQANPSIKCFVYKDASSTRSYDNQPVDLQPCGVRYADAPDAWFAKNGGQRIEYSGYSGHWLMDVGNLEYQAAWAQNVAASVNKYGFDGVFIDNLLWTRNAYGKPPANYATDALWQQAYRGFLKQVRAALAPTGKLALGNLSNARLGSGRWNSYLEFLDGGWDEWWLVINDGDLISEYDAGWTRIVDEVVECEKQGKIALVQPHFNEGSTKPFMYAWASYLMGYSGKSAISEVQRTDGYGLPTPYHNEYGWDLGKPLGVYTSPATNIHVRHFEKAVAVVNANRTGSASVTVNLGSAYGNVSLPGTSGAVIRKI